MIAIVLSEHIILIPVIKAVTTQRCRRNTGAAFLFPRSRLSYNCVKVPPQTITSATARDDFRKGRKLM